MASAILSPISLSPLAEMVPTCAISFRPLVGMEIFFSSSTTKSTAFSMPRFSDIGLAPAVTDFRPSRKIACASTVAVVVPSPAISEVLVATSFTIWAPMFSTGSSSSISLATVTPSLVIVGFPNFFSMTTLRPFGPRVTFTASASWSTPRLRRERASVLNSRYLADIYSSRSAELGDDVGFLDQDDLFLFQLDERAGVLPIHDPVPDLQLHRDPLALFHPARPDRDDLTLDRLLLGRVRNVETPSPLLGLFRRPDGHPLGEREDLQLCLRYSRHDASPPPEVELRKSAPPILVN